jgi:hypothetical protein
LEKKAENDLTFVSTGFCEQISVAVSKTMNQLVQASFHLPSKSERLAS